jgi:hypothetical protein
VIDASEGGALKQGTVVMTLAQALEAHCRAPLGEITADHPGLRDDLGAACIASLEARVDEAKQIEQIARQTLPLLEEIRDSAGDQPRVNRAIARIDALRARMDEQHRCYDLIVQLTQFSQMRRFKADRKLIASRAQGVERQRRQVSRDIDNASAMAQAAAEFIELVGEVIGQLRAELGVSPQTQREAA